MSIYPGLNGVNFSRYALAYHSFTCCKTEPAAFLAGLSGGLVACVYRFRKNAPEAVLAVGHNQGFMLNGGSKNPLT